MATRNPKIKALEEELRKANLRADNEKELRLRTEGKLEKYEKNDEEEAREVRSIRDMEMRHKEELENQISWMRRLIENMALPKDKLKMFRQEEERIQIGMDPRHRPY